MTVASSALPFIQQRDSVPGADSTDVITLQVILFASNKDVLFCKQASVIAKLTIKMYWTNE